MIFSPALRYHKDTIVEGPFGLPIRGICPYHPRVEKIISRLIALANYWCPFGLQA